MQSLGSGNKATTLRVQLRFFTHRSHFESLFFKNVSSIESNFSDVTIVTENQTLVEQTQKYNKEQTTVLKYVHYCSFPIYLNQFEEDATKDKLDYDLINRDLVNREERLLLDNNFYSLVISSILVNFKDVVTINNLIPINELDSIYVVDVPKYIKFNPQTGHVPPPLISYLRNLNCLPSTSNNSSTIATMHSSSLLTKRYHQEDTLHYTQFDYGKVFKIIAGMCKPEFKKIEILQTVVERDPILENLKRKLFEIIRRNKSNIEKLKYPKSLKHFSALQLIKQDERWFLKVNALNLYLKLIMPGSLILDMSQQALINRFLSLLEIQIKSSMFYSSYVYTGWPEGNQPQSFSTKENYEKFVKDRLECFSTLQQEYPGEQYYLVELAKCFELQDNVCLLTAPLSVLRNRLKFINNFREVSKIDCIELNDISYREYSKLKDIVDREICKYKVEKYLVDIEEMKEEEIINIVKEHYNNLVVIVRERNEERVDVSMFRHGITHNYHWLMKDYFDQ
ncbi:hypothetical protein ABK040_016430 [Willaertia magna]